MAKETHNAVAEQRKVEVPSELQSYVRYIVVTDPQDQQAYSVGLKYVCPSKGAEEVMANLEKNLPRKHKKHVRAWLCTSCVVGGEECLLGAQCPNIHVSAEGCKRKRRWTRPGGREDTTAAAASRTAACAATCPHTPPNLPPHNTTHADGLLSPPADATGNDKQSCTPEVTSAKETHTTLRVVHRPYVVMGDGFVRWAEDVGSWVEDATQTTPPKEKEGGGQRLCWADCDPNEAMDFSKPLLDFVQHATVRNNAEAGRRQ